MILSSIIPNRCNTNECIRVYAKGVILGRGICSRLGLQEGDYVGVFCDTQRKGDIYIGSAPAASGYPLHRRGKQYHLHSRNLAQRIFNELGITAGETALFKVGDAVEYEGAMVLPIITRRNYANN